MTSSGRSRSAQPVRTFGVVAMTDSRTDPATRLREAQKQATLAIKDIDDRVVEEDTKAALRLIRAAVTRLEREGDDAQ
jgi:hypothetical protein